MTRSRIDRLAARLVLWCIALGIAVAYFLSGAR